MLIRYIFEKRRQIFRQIFSGNMIVFFLRCLDSVWGTWVELGTSGKCYALLPRQQQWSTGADGRAHYIVIYILKCIYAAGCYLGPSYPLELSLHPHSTTQGNPKSAPGFLHFAGSPFSCSSFLALSCCTC
jgi:hypothetical protein